MYLINEGISQDEKCGEMNTKCDEIHSCQINCDGGDLH